MTFGHRSPGLCGCRRSTILGATPESQTVWQLGAFSASLVELGAIQVCIFEEGSPEIGSLELGTLEGGVAQIRLDQEGPVTVSEAQVSVA